MDLFHNLIRMAEDEKAAQGRTAERVKEEIR
jgi:hypothetical protein